MRPDVKQLVVGRWPGVLAALGVPEPRSFRSARALPDVRREGSLPLRRQGGPRHLDLLALRRRRRLQARHGGARRRASRRRPRSSRRCSRARRKRRVAKERSEAEKRASLRRVWEQARAVQPGDPVHTYLTGRGLPRVPEAVRYVPQMGYYQDGRKVGVLRRDGGGRARRRRQGPQPARHLPREREEGASRAAAEGDAAGRDDRRRRGVDRPSRRRCSALPKASRRRSPRASSAACRCGRR